jgi:hypothetical protein
MPAVPLEEQAVVDTRALLVDKEKVPPLIRVERMRDLESARFSSSDERILSAT